MGSPLFQPVGLLDNSLDIEDTFESNGLLGGSLDSGRGAREQGSSTSILKQLDLNISLQARDYTASTSKSAVASLSNAQEALNVLGSSRRSPVHPRRPAMDDFGMAPDHEIDIDIEAELELERAMNLERQLEMEREMEEEEALMAAEAQEEERPKPTPASSRPASGNKADGHQSMPALLDLEFESNGLLGGPNSRTSTSQPTDAGAQPPSPSTLPSLSQVLPDTQQAGPSRPLPAWATERFKDRPTINSGTDRAIPKYIPAGTIAAVTFEGNVIRFERRKRMRGWKIPKVRYGEGETGLLSQPIHQLMEKVEAQKALAVVERAEQSERAARGISATTAPGARPAGKMWVDRYRPRRFADLLGDERVHREVMAWLKEWDLCVFKRRPKRAREAAKADKFAATPGAPGQPAPWADPYGRPSERVMLISGPPGLGKTTLAHVVAAQAGYGVFELNASDARTASAVEDQVRMALESASMKDSRPTLVVVDEIDGATGGGSGEGGGGGFVKALVKLIEGGKGFRKKGKKGKGSKPLLRPIICICNDLYAPALRPLRPLARLVRFHKPGTNLLVKRLKDICVEERLGADNRSLSLLAELTGGDIRSCLNALQFAKTNGASLSEADIRNSAIGIKDGGTNVHHGWEMLFRTVNPKKKARGGMPKDGNENMNRIVHEMSICNEYDKLAQGCFDHYPTLRPPDDGWARYAKIHDWLHFGQALTSTVYSNQNFELLSFLPWTFVPWHLLFANVGNTLPEYPRVDYENFLKRTAFDEVSTALHLSLPPSLRVQFNTTSVVTELGPSLMRMLSPDLRPVNNQVVKPSERATLDSVVSIMLGLDLRFVQDRAEDGQLFYRLDPPLDAFVQYDGHRSKEVGSNRYAVRQLISREVEAQIIKQRGALAGKAGPLGSGAGAVGGKKGATGTAAQQVRDMIEKEKPALDFFGRPVEKKKKAAPPVPSGLSAPVDANGTSTGNGRRDGNGTRAEAEDPGTDADPDAPPAKKFKVFYRYNEGFSNAVRRPAKISALL